jgi:hypothetical protein
MKIQVNRTGFLELVINNNLPASNNPRNGTSALGELLTNLFTPPMESHQPYFKDIMRASKKDKTETFLALVK